MPAIAAAIAPGPSATAPAAGPTAKGQQEAGGEERQHRPAAGRRVKGNRWRRKAHALVRVVQGSSSRRPCARRGPPAKLGNDRRQRVLATGNALRDGVSEPVDVLPRRIVAVVLLIPLAAAQQQALVDQLVEQGTQPAPREIL